MLRTHTCGELSLGNSKESVRLCGWVARRRDHGGVIFIDLRDQYGVTQVVFDPARNVESYEVAKSLRTEFVIQIEGLVHPRPEESQNEGLTTGSIEVLAGELQILNKSKTPPFEIDDIINVSEENRLRYRYLDLRRNRLHNNIRLRGKATFLIRDFLNRQDFTEIETPILMKSTPEGARDFLVPSRNFPGKFYALPQSPQTYKQLLMVAGFDRYFQIVKCFRDEDFRKDRQPEFTQLDMEMSFVNEEDIFQVAEGLVRHIFSELLDVSLPKVFQRMTFREAFETYGSDKPDLRYGLKITPLNDVFNETGFNAFKGVLEKGGHIAGLKLSAAEQYTRKKVDELIEFAQSNGAKGLAFFRFINDEISTGVAKFFSEKEKTKLRERFDLKENDLCFLIADEYETAFSLLGLIRNRLAEQMNLINEKAFEILWVTDFPLLEYDSEESRYVARHHPFTSPKKEDLSKLENAPQDVKARAYDLVLNGSEIAGGSIRIHDAVIQRKMFKALGISQEEAQEKFGFLMDAFEFGAPPHGGIAFGIDRLMMIISGSNSIRDVMAFPKTSSGLSLMDNSPSEVDSKQLKELRIKTY